MKNEDTLSRKINVAPNKGIISQHQIKVVTVTRQLSITLFAGLELVVGVE